MRVASRHGVILQALAGMAVLSMGPSMACIVASEADHAAELARDRAAQAKLVTPLAQQADTILIAKALREVDEVRWTTEFVVLEVFKGSLKIAQREVYQAAQSVAGIDCTPGVDLFRNTITLTGQDYLLYVKKGKLLRAAKIKRREGNSLSLNDELELIVRVTGSAKAAEGWREK
jgi:hypothetical protein